MRLLGLEKEVPHQHLLIENTFFYKATCKLIFSCNYRHKTILYLEIQLRLRKGAYFCFRYVSKCFRDSAKSFVLSCLLYNSTVDLRRIHQPPQLSFRLYITRKAFFFLFFFFMFFFFFLLGVLLKMKTFCSD